MSCLVLDAKGVIFRAADDVAELLIPFIAANGGSDDAAAIDAACLDASLGRISAQIFWARIGLDAALEDEYLALHALNPGVEQVLTDARHAGVPVWCLSNDVGRWSLKLRTRLGIETSLACAVISADVGVRKPDAEIYRIPRARSGGYERWPA